MNPRLFRAIGRAGRIGFCTSIAMTLWAVTSAVADAPAATAPATTARHLVVGGLEGETRTFSADEFARLPRTRVEAVAPHSDRKATYEGVLLESLFEAAGVDPSDRDTRTKVAQPCRSAYVLVEAADGYQVVFSLPEVFSRFGGSGILLADRQDGAQLAAKAAPYQVVVPRSPEHERWARQVTRILMQRASASPFTAAAPVGGPEARGHAGGVFVVGTGPGAPDLITVRAAELLKRADHVFCFSWMKDELSPMVREGVVEVASPLLRGGQLCGQDPVTGDPELRGRVIETNEELSRLRARIKDLVEDGKTVVFADNGDPMIFSPWSWVPQHLAEFSPLVVPGLSSFNAANAALKRGVAGSGSVLLSSGSEIGHPDSTGRLSGTVVFFTHLKKLDALLPTLQERYPQDTPIAIVCDVSYPAEKVIEGTLGTIHDRLSKQPPLPHLYLVYVGDGLKQPPGCK